MKGNVGLWPDLVRICTRIRLPKSIRLFTYIIHNNLRTNLNTLETPNSYGPPRRNNPRNDRGFNKQRPNNFDNRSLAPRDYPRMSDDKWLSKRPRESSPDIIMDPLYNFHRTYGEQLRAGESSDIKREKLNPF